MFRMSPVPVPSQVRRTARLRSERRRKRELGHQTSQHSVRGGELPPLRHSEVVNLTGISEEEKGEEEEGGLISGGGMTGKD